MNVVSAQDIESGKTNPISFNNYTNNDLCTRFIRKKFQCIMVFLGTLFLFLEVLKLTIEKFDKETIHNLINSKNLFSTNNTIQS